MNKTLTQKHKIFIFIMIWIQYCWNDIVLLMMLIIGKHSSPEYGKVLESVIPLLADISVQHVMTMEMY